MVGGGLNGEPQIWDGGSTNYIIAAAKSLAEYKYPTADCCFELLASAWQRSESTNKPSGTDEL